MSHEDIRREVCSRAQEEVSGALNLERVLERLDGLITQLRDRNESGGAPWPVNEELLQLRGYLAAREFEMAARECAGISMEYIRDSPSHTDPVFSTVYGFCVDIERFFRIREALHTIQLLKTSLGEDLPRAAPEPFPPQDVEKGVVGILTQLRKAMDEVACRKWTDEEYEMLTGDLRRLTAPNTEYWMHIFPRDVMGRLGML